MSCELLTYRIPYFRMTPERATELNELLDRIAPMPAPAPEWDAYYQARSDYARACHIAGQLPPAAAQAAQAALIEPTKPTTPEPDESWADEDADDKQVNRATLREAIWGLYDCDDPFSLLNQNWQCQGQESLEILTTRKFCKIRYSGIGDSRCCDAISDAEQCIRSIRWAKQDWPEVYDLIKRFAKEHAKE